MSIFNDLIEALVERNRIEFSAAVITIGLRKDGIKIKGQVPVSVVDSQKNKMLANLVLPVEANLEIKEVTFPIPTP
jgi:hypothetical protein